MGGLEGVASRLEATAASFVKENRLPGAAVGVVHGDGLAWWAPIGFSDIASGRHPEPTTLYRVASITKTFTATAIMQLRDEGKLHLDDPVARHLPEIRSAANPFGDIEQLTIRRLLSHESGLQSEPPDTDWRAARYEGSVERNLARVAEFSTRVPANTQSKYSNLGFQLLGEIVTRRGGTAYVNYIRKNILDPLEMTNSGFEPLGETLASRRATGYAGRFLSDELELSSTAPSVWAEGGLWSCVEDLARWVSFQLREDGGPRRGAQVLAGETLREMHKPRYIGDPDWTTALGLTWWAVRQHDVIWIQHSGGLHGFRTNVCFDPVHQVGAIVLINGVGDATTLSMRLGEIAREAVLAIAPRIEAPPAMPETYRDLIGFYADRELGRLLRVEWRDGKLMIVDPELPPWRPVLTPTENRDVFLIAPGVRESGENAVFRRLPNERVASVFIAAGTWRRLDPVETPPPPSHST